MKLIGDLKKLVEETNSKEEAKEVIENAGMLLSDDELDNVVGGASGNNEENGCGGLAYCHCPYGKPGPYGQTCSTCGYQYNLSQEEYEKLTN